MLMYSSIMYSCFKYNASFQANSKRFFIIWFLIDKLKIDKDFKFFKETTLF